MLHYIGEECFDIYQTYQFEKAKENKLDALIGKFEAHIIPKKNITFIRHHFFTRDQMIHESLDQYLTELKNRAINCEFGDLKDSLI